jgi:hypothetical protein
MGFGPFIPEFLVVPLGMQRRRARRALAQPTVQRIPDRSGFHYERSVTMDPAIAEVHYNHGVSMHYAGDYKAAVEAFR